MLVANVTDWWVDKPALQPEADPATSTTQTIAGTQDSPTTTTDAPPREEIAAAVESVEPSQAEAAGQKQAETAGQRHPEADGNRVLRLGRRDAGKGRGGGERETPG